MSPSADSSVERKQLSEHLNPSPYNKSSSELKPTKIDAPLAKAGVTTERIQNHPSPYSDKSYSADVTIGKPKTLALLETSNNRASSPSTERPNV